MFGYVKPVPEELLVKEHAFYRALYCGICRAMQKHTGRLSSLALTYDSVFYALVRLMLTGDSCTARRFHCAVHPCRCRQCVEETPTLVFTARAFAVLAYGRVRDEQADRRGLIRIPLFFAARVLRRAARRANLPQLAERMQEELAALAALEKACCSSIDLVADCSGRMLGEFFAAELEGEGREIAYDIGFHLGRFVAAADAAEDYEKDKKNGNYNPYLYIGNGAFEEGERHAAYAALGGELLSLEEAILRLPHDRYPGAGNIIKNILYLGLRDRIAFLEPQERREEPVL
ncbi:MAG: hypothetical protein IJY20_08405 [Clostridia bacterium]|nr:hypothetical protein [Clostridia bacterium]